MRSTASLDFLGIVHLIKVIEDYVSNHFSYHLLFPFHKNVIIDHRWSSVDCRPRRLNLEK